MTEFVDVPGGRIAYEVTGSGPLVVLSHGIAGDLTALTGQLGGPAVVVGHSISCGAATIAVATRPDLVTAIVEINPFTRKVHYSLGGLRIRRYRRCGFLLTGTQLFRSLRLFMRYLNLAYPAKPADYPGYMTALAAKLREPGRSSASCAPSLTTTASSLSCNSSTKPTEAAPYGTTRQPYVTPEGLAAMCCHSAG